MSYHQPVRASRMLLACLLAGLAIVVPQAFAREADTSAPGSPVVAVVVGDRLTFDGETLSWMQGAKVVETYAAFSGDASKAHNEAAKDLGPVPQGRYTVDPSRIKDNAAENDAYRRDWGLKQVALEQQLATRKRMLECLKADRKGFYIHGGTETGTHGCIEINDTARHAAFFKRLTEYGQKIDIEVEYRGNWETLFELATCKYPAPPPGSASLTEVNSRHPIFVPAAFSVLPEPVAPTNCLRAAGAQVPVWATDLEKILGEFLSCRTKPDDDSPCNVFLARALKRVYRVMDFGNPDEPAKVFNANQIAAYLSGQADWTRLGTGDSQSALDQAQADANAGKPVVAVWSNPSGGHGHVALVLPGEQVMSSTWQLRVPNSASFPYLNPSEAYVGCALSKAFSSEKKSRVVLYGRNSV